MVRIVAVMVASLLFLVTGLAGSDEPSPTPVPATGTPSPSEGRSLADVARETRLKDGARTPIVIDNAAVRELAAHGRLTVAGTPTPTPPTRRAVHGGTGESTTSPEEAPGGGRAMTLDETDEDAARSYWRSQYTRQLELVESIGREIERLDKEIPGLWRQFYAWDDPAFRDGVIKPKLDAALEQREKLEQDLVAEQARLPEILEAARRSGALPGWFRDLPRPTPRNERGARQPWGVPTVAP